MCKSRFDHAWRVNCSLHMLSGPCGGTTPSNLPLLGFQPLIATISHSPMTGQHRRVSPGHRHWSRPEHRQRLHLPLHSCRTQTTWDLTSPRRRLSCLWTPAHTLRSPAPLCFGMHPLRLLHTVLLTKMHPHNSPLPSSCSDASSLKTYRDAWTSSQIRGHQQHSQYQQRQQQQKFNSSLTSTA